MNIPPDLNTRVLELENQFKHIPSPILSLFAMLPKPGEEFSAEDRATFLRAFAATCNLVTELRDYKTADFHLSRETIE